MTGTLKLLRLILRRDRVLLPLWAILIGLVPASYIKTFNAIFTTDAERLAYAKTSQNNAGFIALYGPLHGDSLQVLVAWRSGFIPIMVGLFALLTVVRHTRADEEAGRTELIGATVVGRSAQLAAALIATMAASVVCGLVLMAALVGNGFDTAGSLAFGAEFTLAGWAFAGIGAVAVQLAGSARGARTIGIIALGVAYVLRVGGDISALGDSKLSWLSWLSPIGWVTHVFPYEQNAAWPMLLTLLFSAVTVAGGILLLGRRDLGAGLIAPRLGRATAAASLRTPLALAWRLHRGLLIAWTAGFAVLGLVFGGVGSSVDDLADGNKAVTDLFAHLGGRSGLIASYFASIAGIVGLIAACYAVQATLRLRDEEQTGHAEVVLSTAVSRNALLGSHLVFSLLGPAVALLAEGLVAGVTYGQGEVGGIIAGTLLQLPAVWVLAAISVLIFGLLPRWSLVAWGAPAICLLILLVGETLQLNHYVLDISPFTHIPHLPGGSVPATPLVALTALAVVLAVLGAASLRRRNIPD
jgi:polyether ionophore transport system permease protein